LGYLGGFILDKKEVEKGILRYRRKAAEYIKDKNKAKKLLSEASKKTIMEKDRIQSFKEQLLVLLDVYQDWISGKYREIPYKSLTMITIGILYFIVPTDLIPDIFLGAGLIDDAAVLATIFKQISNDIEAYKVWKQKNKDDSVMSLAESEKVE
jgi:uncharacterized membrane protein YkvA (DUF1232 family)